jgi:histidinol-phosphatase (PHP family)
MRAHHRAAAAYPAAPVLYEQHCHTPLCRHAYGEPEEYAERALARGLAGIVFTCHAPLPAGYSPHVRMTLDEFGDYLAMVAATRKAFTGRLDVRLGLESDFLPGLEPWLRDLHARAELHHVLGSVHPQMAEYRERYRTGDPFADQMRYFELLAEAAESGLFDTLSHPDLVKNESPVGWRLERILPHICRALDRIAACGVAMELNTSGVQKAVSEFNPGPEILREVHARGIPVVIGADAHVPERVGDGFDTALRQLREIGFTETHYFVERRRHAVPIDIALASLR